MPKPVLLVVMSNTRPNWARLPIGRWFEGLAARHYRFEVRVADLAVITLPFLDEPKHPRLR